MSKAVGEIVWEPSEARQAQSNLSRFIRFVDQKVQSDVFDYDALYQWSVRNPEKFWPAVWEFCGIRSSRPWEEVLRDGDQMPGARFFPGARLNFAQNLLRHNDQRTAIAFVGEDGRREAYTYAQLNREVARIAAGLRAAGVTSGDRVAGYLPNLPQTVIAMLAATSLGAVWSSCSPDFGVNGVVDRFGQIKPRVLFCADAYLYAGKTFDSLGKTREILKRMDDVAAVVVVPFVSESPDIDGISDACLWGDFGEPDAELSFEQVPFNHPLYVMYSSGTTGKPKCIVHGVGGTLIQHLKELVLHTDLKRDDTIFYFTTCGWMMWNWLVSSLAVGAKVVLYDGSPFHPAPEVLFDLIDGEDISVFGTSAKYISALEKAGASPIDSHRLQSLKTILSTGSPLLPGNYDYVYQRIKPDVALCSISGGTDIVSCFALGNPLRPVRRGELQCRGLGMAVAVLDDEGEAVVCEKGELACLAPFPCMPIGFWNDADGSRYRAAYFERVPGVWCHGDHAEITEHDGLIIYGRSDAVLNPGGVRIGTAEIYRQVEKVDAVVESLVIGQDWNDDVRVVLFVSLRDGLTLDDALVNEIRQVIRANTSPRHVPAKVLQVSDIPRTISGKIVELAVRDIVHGREVKNRDALANPEALDQYRDRPELSEE